jgi:hypothetical protein
VAWFIEGLRGVRVGGSDADYANHGEQRSENCGPPGVVSLRRRWHYWFDVR